MWSAVRLNSANCRAQYSSIWTMCPATFELNCIGESIHKNISWAMNRNILWAMNRENSLHAARKFWRRIALATTAWQSFLRADHLPDASLNISNTNDNGLCSHSCGGVSLDSKSDCATSVSTPAQLVEEASVNRDNRFELIGVANFIWDSIVLKRK